MSESHPPSPSAEAVRLGHHVWSIPHIRLAILEESHGLDYFHLPTYLTLNKATFADVIKVIYREIEFKKYLGRHIPPWIPTERLVLYRASVRVIDLNGCLPACVGLEGGLPALFNVFPLLKGIDCGRISFTRWNANGEEQNRITITSEIYAGSGNSARLARFNHGLPDSWNIHVDFDLTVRSSNRLLAHLKKDKIRPILLKDIKSLSIPGCDEMYALNVLTRLLHARRGAPPIRTIRVTTPIPFEEIEPLFALLGPTVEELYLEIQSEGYDLDDPHPTLGNIFACVDWSQLTAVRRLEIQASVACKEWFAVRYLLWPEDDSIRTTPPPVYTGKPLNLESFQFSFIIFKAGRHEEWFDFGPVFSTNSLVYSLPNADQLVNALAAIGGRTGYLKVRWMGIPEGGEDELYPRSSTIYNYLLEEAVQRNTRPVGNSWRPISRIKEE